jgi:hypothetical protein
VVVFLAERPSVSLVDDWCPLVNFFEHRQAAVAWAAERGVTGTAVPLQQAVKAGAAAWRSQLARRVDHQAGSGAAACC